MGAYGALILQLYHRRDFLTLCGIIDLLHFLQAEKLTRIDHLGGLDCFIEGARSLCQSFIIPHQPSVTANNVLTIFL